MTNEELFTDLKQFVAATISQQTAHLATKDDIIDVRTELKEDITAVRVDIKQLDEKLDLIQDAIADTLTLTTKRIDATTQDHEQRIRRLEHRSA